MRNWTSFDSNKVTAKLNLDLRPFFEPDPMASKGAERISATLASFVEPYVYLREPQSWLRFLVGARRKVSGVAHKVLQDC